MTTRLSIAAPAEIFPDDVLPWRNRAACEPEDARLFYYDGHALPLADIAEAKQVCSRCPVVAECLDDADDFGIWGGLDAAERRRLDLL